MGPEVRRPPWLDPAVPAREDCVLKAMLDTRAARHPERRFALFEDLFETSRGVAVVVVTFIALLELAREHLLEVTQAEAFAPIYVRLAYQPS